MAEWPSGRVAEWPSGRVAESIISSFVIHMQAFELNGGFFTFERSNWSVGPTCPLVFCQLLPFIAAQGKTHPLAWPTRPGRRKLLEQHNTNNPAISKLELFLPCPHMPRFFAMSSSAFFRSDTCISDITTQGGLATIRSTLDSASRRGASLLNMNQLQTLLPSFLMTSTRVSQAFLSMS